MRKYATRRLLTALCLGWCSFIFAGHLAAKETINQAPPPNIIFFFTDDQGWQDLGSSGHPYLQTPNFDRLAKEGAMFEQFYSCASVCSPSRTAFMTGHYPARHRVHGHFSDPGSNRRRGMPDWLDPETETITRILQSAGYRTGHFGKWHLGHANNPPEPGAYGIDDYRTIVGSGPGWDRNGKLTSTDLAVASYAQASAKDYFWSNSTDLIVDQAVAFLETNKGQPFYLNLWALLPHAPNRPTAEQLELYKMLKANPQDFESWMREYAEKARFLEQQMKNYCAAMTSIDTALGRLLEKLDEMQISDNTFFFFTSDNGPEDYNVGNMRNSGMGATGNFRGRKRSLYEGGIRMPCIARWPGVIPAGHVDKTSIIGAVDWLPTVCSIAGVPVPAIKPDGEDVSDILRGTPSPRTHPLFWEWRYQITGNQAYKAPSLAIRDAKWKLFADAKGGSIELYDIPKDPEERTNVAKQNPEVVARLLPKLLEWKQTLP